MIQIYNEDCLKAMEKMPNDYFDLAICDPPYGMKRLGMQSGGESIKMKHFKRCLLGWDIRPSKKYFDQLIRVSKNQIIWGGNYFTEDLFESRCWICWDKKQPFKTFSQIELAWTSFSCVSPIFYYDNRYSGKIHPTQKPVALYSWLLSKYAKKGDRILDTHLGSGSIAIACHNMNYDLTAFEIDTEYYEAALKRLQNHQKQLKLF